MGTPHHDGTLDDGQWNKQKNGGGKAGRDVAGGVIADDEVMGVPEMRAHVHHKSHLENGWSFRQPW